MDVEQTRGGFERKDPVCTLLYICAKLYAKMQTCQITMFKITVRLVYV